MKRRLLDMLRNKISLQQLINRLPLWMKSSATQQGVMFVLVSLFSLVLMASVTILYVDYELGQQNSELVKESKLRATGDKHDIDDDPIEDDDIIAVLTSGFILAGVLVSLFTIAIVVNKLVIRCCKLV